MARQSRYDMAVWCRVGSGSFRWYRNGMVRTVKAVTARIGLVRCGLMWQFRSGIKWNVKDRNVMAVLVRRDESSLGTAWLVRKEVIIMEKTKKKILLEELQRLEQRVGYLEPQVVLKEASDPSSPLHDSFDWDDTTAARKYRLWQARQLIANVKVEFVGEDRQAFYNATVMVEDVPVRGYFSLERVLSDEELHRQVLIEAVKEIETAHKKYDSLKELEGVINIKKLHDVKTELVS